MFSLNNSCAFEIVPKHKSEKFTNLLQQNLTTMVDREGDQAHICNFDSKRGKQTFIKHQKIGPRIVFKN